MYDTTTKKFKYWDMSVLFADLTKIENDVYIITLGILHKNETGIFIIEKHGLKDINRIMCLTPGKRERKIFEIIYPDIKHNLEGWTKYVREIFLLKKQN